MRDRLRKTMVLAAVYAGATGMAFAQYGGYGATQPQMHSYGGGISMLLRGGAVVPDRSDEWDVGGGFDMGLVIWPSRNVGLWLGAGAQRWRMKKEFFGLDDGGWAYIHGDVDVVPIGASLMLWSDLGENFALVAEGGFRYAVVDSDGWVTSERPYGSRHVAIYEDPIDIGNTALAVASLQLEYNAHPLTFGLGAGFQWDLSKPDQKLSGAYFGETSLSAALFYANLGIVF
jgi:hypothetical protein